MAAIAFDTLKAARRLKEAGVPETQTEAQAELMAEAFIFNRDYLEQCLDARFAALDGRFERIETHLTNHHLQFADIRVELKLHPWMLGLIAASTVIPALQKLFAVRVN